MIERHKCSVLWAEIDRVQSLLRIMEDEASKLKIDISADKLYIALQAYIEGLRVAENM